MLWKWAIFKKGVFADISHSWQYRRQHRNCCERILKFNAPVNSSNVEDCHCLKLTNNAPQKVFVKLPERKGVYPVLKAKPSLKNADLTGTLLPPDIPIFVNQTL